MKVLLNWQERARLCLGLACLGGLLFYVVKTIQKYADKKISTSTQRYSSGKFISFPDITICSGFRDAHRTPRLLAKVNWDNPNVESEDVLSREALANMTFTRLDFLTQAVQAVDDRDNDLLLDDTYWDIDFHPYFGGNCHTLHPPFKTKAGEVHSIRLGIRWPEFKNEAHCNDNDTRGCFYHFATFFHSPGAFMYNKGKKYIANSFIYPGQTKQKQYYILAKKEKKLMDKSYEPCNPDIDMIDWKSCITEYFNEKNGCRFPWDTSTAIPKEVCNLSQINWRLRQSVEHHTWWDIDSVIEEATGCLKPCQYEEYQLINEPNGYHIINGLNTDAMVQLYYVDTVTEFTEEFLAFDGFSLLGELGGALGLFLGMSIFQLLHDLARLFSDAWKRRRSHKILKTPVSIISKVGSK